jgi:hypothetical protein
LATGPRSDQENKSGNGLLICCGTQCEPTNPKERGAFQRQLGAAIPAPGTLRHANFAVFVKPVILHSEDSATLDRALLPKECCFNINQQGAMLNWHFAIYNKLAFNKNVHTSTIR